MEHHQEPPYPGAGLETLTDESNIRGELDPGLFQKLRNWWAHRRNRGENLPVSTTVWQKPTQEGIMQSPVPPKEKFQVHEGYNSDI
jgi:hypothetical protein